LTASNEDKVKDKTHECFIKMKDLRMNYLEDFYFLEAMKAPINKIKDKYRFQIVCRFSTERESEIINKIFRIVEEIQDKNIQIFIETNPQNLS